MRKDLWAKVWLDLLWDASFLALSEKDQNRYVKLILLAKLSEEHRRGDAELGLLLDSPGKPMTARHIANWLRISEREFRSTLARIEQELPGKVIVETLPDGSTCYRLRAYTKRQYGSDTPGAVAARVSQYRDRKRAADNGGVTKELRSSNDAVTAQLRCSNDGVTFPSPTPPPSEAEAEAEADTPPPQRFPPRGARRAHSEPEEPGPGDDRPEIRATKALEQFLRTSARGVRD